MQVFVEVEIGVTPYWIQFPANNTQTKSKPYGIKHHVTSIIHAAMGDTLKIKAPEISLISGN